MKTNKLTWGGKNNTKVLRMISEQDTLNYNIQQQTSTTQQTTETYIEPTGETQNYPINQVLVTPGNLTAWGSLTINWLNSEVQQQTQEVDSTQNWAEEQEQKYNEQSDTDYI
jgi:hypothetical protein|tara:strand:- start:34 stop:369 length:336 start_codon:yes stop_codon:yes gene_type:complete